MLGTIARTKDGRIINAETVYETARQMKGNFSTDNMMEWINAQLEPEEQLSRKMVKGALEYVSSLGTNVVKFSGEWYGWK